MIAAITTPFAEDSEVDHAFLAVHPRVLVAAGSTTWFHSGLWVRE
ncbi:MAG: hypothetical protein V3W41_18145 [Planctomycetota bacterium]